MRKGKIIILNGTSSSGKTSIAKELQRILKEPYLLVSIDNFIKMLPVKYFTEEDVEEFEKFIPRVVSGMHHSIAGLAKSGNNVIVDHVLQEHYWLIECVKVLKGIKVLFVGVRCPLKELERRENKRNRQKGLARFQFDRVHSHNIYDFEIDTSENTCEECALQVRRALNQLKSSIAFNRLRRKYKVTDKKRRLCLKIM